MENQALLIRRNAFLILNLGFDIFDTVAAFDLKSDGLSSQGFTLEDLHVFFLSGFACYE